MFELKEAVKDDISNPVIVRVIIVAEKLSLDVVQKVCCSAGTLIVVNLQGGLVGAERDELATVRTELSEETRRFLYVD
jgi:hypothetical protein